MNLLYRIVQNNEKILDINLNIVHVYQCPFTLFKRKSLIE